MNTRVALVSLHTSPLEQPGSGDAGGMNVYLVGLAEALAASGVEVELLTRAVGGEHPDARTPGGVPVRALPAGPVGAVPKGRLTDLAPEFGRAMSQLPRFDVVHSHYWLSGLAALPVADAWGAPHVLSLHTLGALKNARLAPGDSAEPAARIEGERMLVRASALTVAATQAERNAIVEATDAGLEAVTVVPPGVDTSLFHPDGSVVTRARPFVLVLARIQPLKGIDLAITALARIPAAERPMLVVAGGASPGHDAYAASLHRLATELLRPGDLEFLPAQSREATAALLRAASLLLVPSHSETFGLVALEAAASGTPVVAGRAGGLAEAVSDGVSGVLIEGRDPETWARVIRSLLSDPHGLATLSASAAAFGAARSWAAAAADLRGHYDHLLGR
ncbi:MAG: glycosyltransferase [Herbiconiux sp.]|uniref:glycosyltransferase n=1 Tax=Herbiconiux sp. TaxID=1871186 RepID=UPI0012240C16|nr:glycosyltransferase [Herbiconiux sp.]TAJ48355.1 MAG: glycosyltransferase [Herbiconiux sp.]